MLARPTKLIWYIFSLDALFGNKMNCNQQRQKRNKENKKMKYHGHHAIMFMVIAGLVCERALVKFIVVQFFIHDVTFVVRILFL